MLATVLAVAVGEKYKLPRPVLLTAVGAAAAFLPVDVHLDIEPELILPIFLPQLLWALARKASWGMFRFKWRTMLNFSVLLVFVTIAAVTGTLMWMIPGLGFAAAMAIAAAIASPDPVAVDAVAEPSGSTRVRRQPSSRTSVGQMARRTAGMRLRTSRTSNTDDSAQDRIRPSSR